MINKFKTVVFSRTDSIGDVVLTLPMLGIFKEKFPSTRIIFLGRKYTRPIADYCLHIDEFKDWDEISAMSSHEISAMSSHERIAIFKALKADVIIHVFPDAAIAALAKKSNIPLRIGSGHRIYHWFTCNKLVNFTRKNSSLHEAQLNLKLLEPFGFSRHYSLDDLSHCYGFKAPDQPRTELTALLSKDHFNLILHPKSKGSAREWGLKNFSDLIKILPSEKYKIFISGTNEEGEMMREFITAHPQAIDLTGKFSLKELIDFINAADGIVAASTGPLHIAAALGKIAIGIYAPMRPIHPGRWAPVGKNAEVLVLNKKCDDCRKTRNCVCIRSISPVEVARKLIPRQHVL